MSRAFIIVWAVICLIPFSQSRADTRNEPVIDKVYNIGFSQGAPFHHQAKDRLALVYAKAGLKVKFTGTPSFRSLRNANIGSLDGDVARVPSVVTAYPNLRKVNASLITLFGCAYTIKGKVTNIDLQKLAGIRIGRIRGVLWAEKLDTTRNAVIANDHEHLFKLLLRGRIDVAFATALSADHILSKSKNEYTTIIKLHPHLYSTPTYHYVHKSNEAIIPKLEEALRALKDTEGWRDESRHPPFQSEVSIARVADTRAISLH